MKPTAQKIVIGRDVTMIKITTLHPSSALSRILATAARVANLLRVKQIIFCTLGKLLTDNMLRRNWEVVLPFIYSAS